MVKNSLAALIVLFCVSAFAGCGGSDSDSSPVSIKFAAKVNGKDAGCGVTYQEIGSRKSALTINDIRFFVFNVRLLDRNGEEHKVTLTQDGVWQYQDVALLDFENGTAGCSELGTAETNTEIKGESDLDEVAGVKFDIGIPFNLNHLDPTTVPAPLNVSALNWFWQVGHIFYRNDFFADGKPFFVHLGSSGCVSDAFTSPPTEPCSNPNIPTITLTNYTSEKTVVLDIGTLLQGVDLTKATPNTAPGCMSERNDNECAEVYPNFGLSLETGKCVENCANQSAFYVQ
jgi:uncharacterized repeat protein (TIGR04052 family)